MTKLLSVDDAHQLLALFQDMHAAALANDWGRLAELEAQASEVRSRAQQAPDALLSPQQQAELQATIQQILALDGEIRQHAEPALASIRKLLSGSVKSRTVLNAYTSLGG
jgi:flagellar protein FliT